MAFDCFVKSDFVRRALPCLRDLPALPRRERLRTLLSAASAAAPCHLRRLRALPRRWRLHVAACRAFALEAADPGPASDPTPQPLPRDAIAAAVDALVLCLLMLDVFAPGANAGASSSRKGGSHRMCKMTIDSKAGAIGFRSCKGIGDSSSSGDEGENKGVEGVEDALLCLTAAERALTWKALEPLRLMDKHLKSRPQWRCMWAVHQLARFQSILLHLRHANALLGWPLPDAPPQRAFDGTFAYNALVKHLWPGRGKGQGSARAKPCCRTDCLLAPALPPAARALFERTRDAVHQALLPEVNLCAEKDSQATAGPAPAAKGCWAKSATKRHSRRGRGSKAKVETITKEPSVKQEEEAVHIDPCNRFAALTLTMC